MTDATVPRLEGTVTVRDGRQLGFAEFGAPKGRAIVWMHGTPGARRQVPEEARTFALEHDLRIVGIDRPGIGSSTPHLYDSIFGFTDDLGVVLDCLGIDEFAAIGLSGGGPYALAAGVAFPERAVALGILGGVAPTTGGDAIGGGLVALGAHFRPLLSLARIPIGMGLTLAVRTVRPLASPILDLYARLSPEGDRRLLQRPEFKAMFLDDLLNGSRKQLTAPMADLLLFTQHWGFDVADVKVPVRWWHGDSDHIVPFAHGEHVVARLHDARLVAMPGESHLGGLGVSREVLPALLEVWDAR
jgi:pimeloyl-ACP methyl ester carboxylesterase